MLPTQIEGSSCYEAANIWSLTADILNGHIAPGEDTETTGSALHVGCDWLRLASYYKKEMSTEKK